MAMAEGMIVGGLFVGGQPTGMLMLATRHQLPRVSRSGLRKSGFRQRNPLTKPKFRQMKSRRKTRSIQNQRHLLTHQNPKEQYTQIRSVHHRCYTEDAIQRRHHRPSTRLRERNRNKTHRVLPTALDLKLLRSDFVPKHAPRTCSCHAPLPHATRELQKERARLKWLP